MGGERTELVVPQAQVEETLARIWGQVLGVEQVGINDNFFALGGDSILSIQIGTRAAQVGLRLTPKLLFQHQTIAELAAVVEIIPEVTNEQGLVTGDMPLLPMQRWFFAQQQPQMQHWNKAVLVRSTLLTWIS